MLQLSTCVSVECDRCGNHPQGRSQTHRGREANGLQVVRAALDAAGAVMSALIAAGWRVVDARLLCPDCVLVAQREATGRDTTVVA